MPHKSKFLPPTQQEPIPLEKNAQNRPRNNFQEIPYQLDTLHRYRAKQPHIYAFKPLQRGQMKRTRIRIPSPRFTSVLFNDCIGSIHDIINIIIIGIVDHHRFNPCSYSQGHHDILYNLDNQFDHHRFHLLPFP